MQTCSKCNCYPVLISADRAKKNTFGIFPYYNEDLCYYCSKISRGLFTLPQEFFLRGNLVNSQNDQKNERRFSDGLH